MQVARFYDTSVCLYQVGIPSHSPQGSLRGDEILRQTIRLLESKGS